MGIGFSFTADARNKEYIKQALSALSQERNYTVYQEQDDTCVHFCRLGNLYFHFEPKEGACDEFELTGTCKTNLVGAGFHAAAIAFIDALKKETGLTIHMDDETDYDTDRDFQRMRTEHFYNWLRSIVNICDLQVEKGNGKDLCVCWDIDQYSPEEIDQTVVTPFGRFHIKDMVAQVEQYGIESFAKEFFIWNEEEQDALFYRNTALSLLWEDCYFMPSSRSDEDFEVNQMIIDCIEEAAALDIFIPLPKAIYHELCKLHDHMPVDLSDWPEYESRYPIGYRKGLVREKIGNISFLLPGSYLYLYDQEGQTNDYIWHDGLEENWHSIRITGFRRREGNAEFNDRIFTDTEEAAEEFSAGDGIGRYAYEGRLQDDDGFTYSRSIAEVLCGSQVLFISVSYENPAEKQWAKQFFCSFSGKLPKEQEENNQ